MVYYKYVDFEFWICYFSSVTLPEIPVCLPTSLQEYSEFYTRNMDRNISNIRVRSAAVWNAPGMLVVFCVEYVRIKYTRYT